MKKLVGITCLLGVAALVLCRLPNAAAQNLPLEITPAKAGKSSDTLVFYFSGDGGWKPFSQDIVAAFAAQGTPSIGVNSLSYFKDERTPAQQAADFAPVLRQYLKTWNKRCIHIVGFSFGADIAPFFELALPDDLKTRVTKLVMLSPAKTTDFQVHYADRLGMGTDSYDNAVFTAVAKTRHHPIHIVYGEDEKSVLPKGFSQANVHTHRVVGGHEYEDALEVLELVR